MNADIASLHGRRALILHRKDRNRDALESQLHRIGLDVACLAPLSEVALPDADVIFFDADLGYQGLFPWNPSEAPVPLIAILASEAPGRIEWALDQGATAWLHKPIGSTGVFSALAVALRLFEERRQMRASIADLSERVRARPIVVRATLAVMSGLGVDENRALGLLRQAAMRERVTVELLSVRIAAGGALAGLLPQEAVATVAGRTQPGRAQLRRKQT
ncbi:MAG TPA: ANTAR domain-containing protein [Acetobacteraceae bacterium]|nr:ANTAR domain-containing protein [Acetobacteraceae bacterium]